MSIEQTLMQRGDSCCELCKSKLQLSVYSIPPDDRLETDKCALLCNMCIEEIESEGRALDQNHWRCLNDSMWSQTPAIQVLVWRLLDRLSEHSWAQDLLEMLYLEDDILNWATSTQNNDINSNGDEATFDSNGAQLDAGDTVTLIKDLVVKGAGFTAKRGTAVRNISLTSDPSQIEGKVNGTRIVLLTQYLKKSN